MKTIICKKCGRIIDASLGECPNCGAIYYILAEGGGEAGASPAPTWQDPFTTQDLDISNISKDDIFNTSVWKTDENLDGTKHFNPVAQPQIKRTPPPQPPVRRQSAPQSVRTGSSEARPSPASGKKSWSSKQKRLMVAAVAMLAVLVLIISIMSDAFDFSSGDKMTMPSVINYGIGTATNILKNMELDVYTQGEYNIAPEGTVIAQSIKEDAVVKAGTRVTLTVSLGPNEDTSVEITEVMVPTLLNKTYNQAVYELELLGLLNSTGEPQYSDKPEGTVIFQNPTQGTTIRKGDMVLIILSKGPEPSPSPTSYAISVTAGSGGTVSPKGIVSVVENEAATFTITPNEGYEVREVKVDGVDMGPITSYTFTNVTDDHSLYVVFKVKTEDSPSPSPSPTTTPSPSPPQTPETLGPVE